MLRPGPQIPNYLMIYTDHEALETILKVGIDVHGRIATWMDRLTENDYSEESMGQGVLRMLVVYIENVHLYLINSCSARRCAAQFYTKTGFVFLAKV